MHKFSGNGNSPTQLRDGGYYSIVDGDQFAIAKVLRLEPDKVHVRIYKEHFAQRPAHIDPARLTLGTIHDSDGFGMSHLPLTRERFYRSEPVFITESPVTANELKGYELWKEVASGGVFE